MCSPPSARPAKRDHAPRPHTGHAERAARHQVAHRQRPPAGYLHAVLPERPGADRHRLAERDPHRNGLAPSCSNGFRTKSAVSPPASLVPGPRPATSTIRPCASASVMSTTPWGQLVCAFSSLSSTVYPCRLAERCGCSAPSRRCSASRGAMELRCATPRHRRAGSWRGAHRPPGAGRADHRRCRRPAPRPRSRPLGRSPRPPGRYRVTWPPGAGRAGHRPRLGATPVRTPCRSMAADAIRNPPASRPAPTAAAPRSRAAPVRRSRRSAATPPDRSAPRSPPPA